MDVGRDDGEEEEGTAEEGAVQWDSAYKAWKLWLWEYLRLLPAKTGQQHDCYRRDWQVREVSEFILLVQRLARCT